MSATYFLVRIIPSKLVAPNAFRDALSNITITASDKTVSTAGTDRVLGSAQGLAPLPTASTVPPLVVQNNPPRFDTSILQHLRPVYLPPNPLPISFEKLSVATAVIVVNQNQIGNNLEYPTSTSFDISLQITLTSGSGNPRAVVSNQVVDYNIKTTTAALSTVQNDYTRAATDIYLSIDVPDEPLPDGTTVLRPGQDGRPPSFETLRTAINSVLLKDHPTGAPSVEEMTAFLTPAECQQIASELVNNRTIDPLPVAPYPTIDTNSNSSSTIFEDLYTLGAVTDDKDKQARDMDRQKFEGDRTSYYAVHSSDALQLANHIFSLVTAVQAEQYTQQQGKMAALDVPIKETSSHTSAKTAPQLSLTGSVVAPGTEVQALNPPFVVPAPFIYALTTSYAISQSFDTRIKVLLTSSADTLQGLIRQAIDAGVLNPPSADGYVYEHSTLTATVATNINQNQAIRRLVALQPFVQSATDRFVRLSGNSDVVNLVTSWLDFKGIDDNILDEFWRPLFSSRGYLVALLEIIAPNQETLISGIFQYLRTPSNALVTTVDDLLQISELAWLAFFQAHGDLLPPRYILGDLVARVHAFVVDVAKILYVPGSPQPPETHSPSGIPSLDGTFERDVLVTFFASFTTFSFSNPMDAAMRQQVYDAALALFGGDADVATFVRRAVEELWTVYRVTDLGLTSNLRFSYMESLHARGFTTVDSIMQLPEASFTRALVGTVAYQRASDIYALAENLPWDPDDGDTLPGTTFKPINSGSLVDCVPPCHLSPFGPIQYLHDILEISDGEGTLRDALTRRRGDFGSLLVTGANEDLALPVVDIVMENLEGYASQIDEESYEGQVYNTLDNGLTELDIPGAKPLHVPSTLSATDLLRALPQHSTPHALDSPNIYERLKAEILRPELPYSQGLDIGRTYLAALGTSRFETLRTFQKQITELALDNTQEPSEFQTDLWRFPVRKPIAIEYLCMSEEEACTIFGGNMSASTALQMIGIRGEHLPSTDTISRVTFFLQVTGLSYCEFLELHKCGIVAFRPDTDPRTDDFPPCLPCCADGVRMTWDSETPFGLFLKMVIFARLWRKLRGRCQGPVSMNILADICNVLHLFNDSNVNPSFITQLSSLLMFQEVWNVPWTNSNASNVSLTQADQRTQLLALWSGARPDTQQRKWAVNALLVAVERYSMATFNCPQQSASWRKIIAENIDQLASLAGFNGRPYEWDSKPTCTIRFVEILSKLYASKFTVGEILFLFTNNPHLRGDDPYPSTEEDESLDDPLNVPEDEDVYGLWALRRRLLDVCASEDDACRWTWARIEGTLRKMGFGEQFDNYGTSFGEHFFPEILEEEGRTVGPESRRFETQLPISATNASIWVRAGECSPFHAETRGDLPSILWTRLPLRDGDVLRALRELPQLNDQERGAVQRLYLAPRGALTPFAFIFSNFGRAADHLIQESCVYKRWRFFQHEFALFVRRCHVIAHHIHDAVVAATNIDSAECLCVDKGELECAGAKVAWEILLRLIADGNRAQTPWEDDSGRRPQGFDVSPQLTGGAFAALLGLTGTGLLGEYTGHYNASWTETRGGLSGWGTPNNYWNSPIPTVLPRLDITASQDQSVFASFKNGFALNQDTGDVLGGAEPFTVTFCGVLLVENDGCYHFAIRCPKHSGDDDGACQCEKFKQWSVTLQRGQKTWSLLDQGFDEHEHTHNIPDRYSKPIPLRRGAYDITVKFRQPEPDFDDDDDLRHFHTGFILKYEGPDTENCLVEVPNTNLYLKDRSGRIGYNNDRDKTYYAGGVYERYLTSLRDIRRTYQRAFKSVLFAHRFCLSACRNVCEWESELGYLLSHPDKFQGVSYYVDRDRFHVHRADFDFNFLPVGDTYFPPSSGVDKRVDPSLKRSTALFDWFERIFDYTRLRRFVREVCEPPVWLLFYHADEDSPQPVSQLVRFLDIDIALAGLTLEYFQPPCSTWKITDTANLSVLTDERWVTRVWHAGRYVERLKKHFYAPVSEVARCRPALWAASPDGNVMIDGTTGNANLMRFVQRSALSQTDAPPRLNLIINLNDGLRLRARTALLAFLAAYNRPIASLTDRFQLDVEAGIGETTTRIDDAIAATQNFMQRVILGLEGSRFQPDGALLKRWECELSSFDKWQAAQRRKWYYENWVHWEESAKLSKSEGFQSLKKSLGADVSTLSRPERSQYWTQESLPEVPGKTGIPTAQAFSLTSQQNSLDEGLRLLGTPDHSGKPTWLATTPGLAVSLPDPGRDELGIPNDTHPKFSPSINTTNSGDEAQAHVLLPGSEALDYIPLWIQAAVRLGTRFLRVAASGLPIAAPYASSGNPTPCCVCKRDHAPVVDEYYFWLEDARYFEGADAPAPQNADLHQNTPGINEPNGQGQQIDPRTREADPTSDWDTPTPQMLTWKSRPLVHLRWTRVHMGVLLDPRRSTEGVHLTDSQLSTLNLDLVGRSFDSLVFSIFANNQTLGFRYDIAIDSATVLPEAVPSTNPPALPLPASLAGPLTAFPYFLYFEAGAPLVPVDTFSTSLVVAASLKADCRFGEALNWLRLAFDPLSRDNSWMQCRPTESSLAKEEDRSIASNNSGNLFSISLISGTDKTAVASGDASTLTNNYPPDVPCCPTSPVKSARARGRAATLEYLETLLVWANTLRSKNSLEASQQALTLLLVIERVLGPTPGRVNARDTSNGSIKVGDFVPYAAPLNPRLLQLYYQSSNAVESIRMSLNKQRLRNGELGRDLAHFGSNTRFDFESAHTGPNDCGSSCCFSCCHPYRFTFILPKALQWVALAKATATALQTAIEKADSEALSSLRLAQERQINELTLEISKNQYRAADWEVQALDKQMAHAITRLQYFQRLIELGLNTGEIAHVATTAASMGSRTSATIIDGVAQGMAAVPDMWVGVAGVAGSPLQFNQMPMGVKLGTGFATAARILNTVADISGTSAGLSLTQSGWDRREDEWQHNCDLAVLEIQQIKRQRLASRRRLEISLKELNNAQRRIEHSAEVQDFARDKTSRYELYLYLQQENSILYRQSYELALETAREAQQAVRFELGDLSLSYIPPELGSWDNLHEGLLAGDKLELALSSMERAHMSKHCREYELTKHISLRLHFPAAFVLLKATGYCEIDLPEWLFDLDYPSHYMRRVKAVSLTVPCVAGPYTGVHCKLQQLSSSIRFRPMRTDKDNCKCCPKKKAEKEKLLPPAPCPNDPHIWRRYAGTESIATSTGQSDSGLFELAFSDARYLPFEYTGAVSRWRIELPRENNQFDFDSLSDLLMHVNYTAREGGDEFARESSAIAQKFLPGGGWRFFDVRHELPEVWNVVRREVVCERCQWRDREDCECEDHDECQCGREKEIPREETRHGHEKHDENHHSNRHGEKWCDKCQRDHRADERKCHTSHEDYSDEEHDGNWREKSHRRHPHKAETKKKKPRHAKREFRLSLTRDRFPFLTGQRGVSVTSVHLLIDSKDCDLRTAKLHFTPPNGHNEGKDCVDTQYIPLVPGEGGMLKGSLVLKSPVQLGERACNDRGWGDNGVIGTFSLPCELKDICSAWLLCGYGAEERQCCEVSAGCCN